MGWIPSIEEKDKLEGIYKVKNKKCLKCSKQLYWYDGGDQGDIPHYFCKECDYEQY